MKSIILLVPLLFLTLGIEKCSRSVNECSYHAWIVVEPQESCLKITAYCFNNTSQDSIINYELKARKEGKSGKTSTQQAGSLLIPSKKRVSLSTLSLGIASGDCYKIELRVYKGQTLIAQDSVHSP